jgi:hypothetical protein
MSVIIRISIDEVDLLLDALARASRRHESLAGVLKPGGKFGGIHDRKAGGMRALRTKLLGMRSRTAPMALEIAS